MTLPSPLPNGIVMSLTVCATRMDSPLGFPLSICLQQASTTSQDDARFALVLLLTTAPAPPPNKKEPMEGPALTLENLQTRHICRGQNCTRLQYLSTEGGALCIVVATIHFTLPMVLSTC